MTRMKYLLLRTHEAFGNRAEELYYALLKCRKDERHLILLSRKWDLPWKFRFRQANAELLRIRHPLIVRSWVTEVINIIFTMIVSLLRIVGLVWLKAEKTLGMASSSNGMLRLSEVTIGRAELWEEYRATCDRFDSRIDWGAAYSSSLGVEYGSRQRLEDQFPVLMGKRYICLHVRTSGFLSDLGLTEARNADILNYLPAIEKLQSLGFVVVRLGDPSMPPLCVEGVLDYAHCDRRNEKNDILLIEHCERYIGSISGPIDLACLFEKRILAINVVPILHSYWYRNGSRFIPKVMVVNGKAISIKEQLDRHLLGFKDDEYLGSDFQYLENSSEEILQAVEEFMANTELSIEQDEFNRYLMNTLLTYCRYRKLSCSSAEDFRQKERWLARFYAMNGGIGADYLRRHWTYIHDLTSQGDVVEA